MPETAAPPRPPAARQPGLLDSAAKRGAIFAAAVVLALLAGYSIGKVSVPAPDSGDPVVGVPAGGSRLPGAQPSAAHSHGPEDAAAAGLSATVGQYTLVPDTTTFPVGTAQPMRFAVQGPYGPVLRYETVHDRKLHLIVVRADLSGFQHLHPELGTDGYWSVPLTLGAPGTYRMYADFTMSENSGRQLALVLGVQLTAAGAFAPEPLPGPATAATVEDLSVTLTGSPKIGSAAPMTARVTKGGAPAQLERYLGAFGHLVVVREADLGYLHVHPDEQLVDNGVRFWVSAPGPGRYRAFFDFSIGGVVRTAAFTVQVA